MLAHSWFRAVPGDRRVVSCAHLRAGQEADRMLDDRCAQDLRRHWDEGWNEADLDTIMAPFAEGVVFSSPFVPALAGDPAKTTIDGYDALRSYVDYALRHHPGIRYTVECLSCTAAAWWPGTRSAAGP